MEDRRCDDSGGAINEEIMVSAPECSPTPKSRNGEPNPPPRSAGPRVFGLARHRVRLNPKNLTKAPHFGFRTSLVKTSSKNLPWAHAVAKMLGIGENQIQIVPDNVSYPEVTVVVGKDYPAWVK